MNCVTKSGVTPLHRAAYRGNTEIVQLLLRGGASPSAQDCDGKTALHKVLHVLSVKFLYYNFYGVHNSKTI